MGHLMCQSCHMRLLQSCCKLDKIAANAQKFVISSLIPLKSYDVDWRVDPGCARGFLLFLVTARAGIRCIAREYILGSGQWRQNFLEHW